MTQQFPIGFNRESKAFEEPRIRPIPSRTQGCEYEYDVDLGADIVSFMDMHFHEMPEEQQTTLKAVIMGQSSFRELDYPYVIDLFECDQRLQRRVRAACLHDLAATLVVSAPFFVWALNQPWASEINALTAMYEWGENAMNDENNNNNHFAGVLYLSQMLPLAPFIPETFRLRFFMEVLRVIQQKNPMMISGVHIELRAHLFTLLGEMAQKCGTGPGIYKSKKSMLDHWVLRANSIFKNYSNHEHFVASLLKSTITRSTLGIVLQESYPKIWTIPEVVPIICATLPVDEVQRLEKCTWSWGNEEGINQTIVRLYCPTLYPLIDLVAEPKNWEEQGDIIHVAKSLNMPNGMDALEIPSEVFTL